MPTYDYRCSECGHEFEEFQSMSADPLLTCPNCGKSALKRVLGAGAGMIFKGNGFYLTDYKKTGSSPPVKTAAGKGSKKLESPPSTPSADAREPES